jgi:hypothetical protein
LVFSHYKVTDFSKAVCADQPVFNIYLTQLVHDQITRPMMGL